MRETIPKNLECFESIKPEDLSLRSATEKEYEHIEKFIKKRK